MPWVVTACSLRYEARDRAMAVGQPTEHVMPVDLHILKKQNGTISHIRLLRSD